MRYTVDDYYNETNDRKDSTLSFEVNGSYSPVDDARLGLSYERANRDSSLSGLDYSQNVVTLSLMLAI